MATAAQFLNLPEHQTTWVADFVDHDLRVHDKYYRMHTDAVNLAIVTKLLYMVNSGKIEDRMPIQKTLTQFNRHWRMASWTTLLVL